MFLVVEIGFGSLEVVDVQKGIFGMELAVFSQHLTNARISSVLTGIK